MLHRYRPELKVAGESPAGFAYPVRLYVKLMNSTPRDLIGSNVIPIKNRIREILGA
jgi:hypothetical protein